MKLPINDPRPLDQGLYKIDIFNSDPIFSIKPKKLTKTLYVKSWEEAFALHGEAFFSDINPIYVAKLICQTQTTQDSPYKRIKRLPRSHFINLFADGEIETFPDKPFSNGATLQREKDLHKLIDYLFQDKLSEILSENHGKIHTRIKHFQTPKDANLMTNTHVRSLWLQAGRRNKTHQTQKTKT